MFIKRQVGVLISNTFFFSQKNSNLVLILGGLKLGGNPPFPGVPYETLIM